MPPRSKLDRDDVARIGQIRRVRRGLILAGILRISCKRQGGEAMQAESRPGDDGGPVARGPETVVQAEHSSDVGSRYLDALSELQQREGEILRMVATIQQAAKCLEHWQAVDVVHAGAGFPKEVTMVGRSIDALTWPTAQQLADTLAAWHGAAEIARTAWARLPGETRSNVLPPP
jgi:hypothetical protein